MLFWRYRAEESWDAVARECGMSEKDARRYADVAIDAADAYEIARAMDGDGLAE